MKWTTSGKFGIGNYEFSAKVDVIQKFDNGSICLDVFCDKPLPQILWKDVPIRSHGDEGPYVLEPAHIAQCCLVDKDRMLIRTFRARLTSHKLPAQTKQVTFSAYIVNAHGMLGNYADPADISIGGVGAKITTVGDKHWSHQIVFEGIPYVQKQQVEELLNKVCWLLSLATGNQVAVACLETGSDGGLIEVDVRYPDVTLRSMFPLLDLGGKGEVEKLLATLASFEKHNIGGFISHLIHILLLARNSQYPQVRALLLSNYLEILRFKQGMDMVTSGSLKLEGDIFEWLTGPSAGRRATFNQLLQEFCTTHAISGWDNDFTDIRNEIVHTGHLNGSFDEGCQRCFALHEFCDRILMALLDWDKCGGSYYRIDDPSPTGSPAKLQFNR